MMTLFDATKLPMGDLDGVVARARARGRRVTVSSMREKRARAEQQAGRDKWHEMTTRRVCPCGVAFRVFVCAPSSALCSSCSERASTPKPRVDVTPAVAAAAEGES